jgi:hypothetical protein
MSGIIFQNLRRVNGAAGAPSTAGRLAGEVFLNFAGAPGSGELSELWAYDGTAWRRVNPVMAVDAYANSAEVLAGESAATKLNPAGLQSRTRMVSAGAADAGYIPRLNASGLIDSSMLPTPGAETFYLTFPELETAVNAGTLLASTEYRITGTALRAVVIDATTSPQLVEITGGSTPPYLFIDMIDGGNGEEVPELILDGGIG